MMLQQQVLKTAIVQVGDKHYAALLDNRGKAVQVLGLAIRAGQNERAIFGANEKQCTLDDFGCICVYKPMRVDSALGIDDALLVKEEYNRTLQLIPAARENADKPVREWSAILHTSVISFYGKNYVAQLSQDGDALFITGRIIYGPGLESRVPPEKRAYLSRGEKEWRYEMPKMVLGSGPFGLGYPDPFRTETMYAVYVEVPQQEAWAVMHDHNLNKRKPQPEGPL